MCCKFLVVILISSLIVVHSLEWRYHNHTQLGFFLKKFTTSTKGNLNATLYTIGKTRKNNKLWVVELTAVKKEKVGVPNIKLIGTVHGNEPVGREIILHFMEYLRDNYKSDLAITWLLDNTRIHFLPSLNPDGFALSHENMCNGEHVRNNGRAGQDLNRNFPDFYHENKFPEEPETKAVKAWMDKIPFVLSAALHGGALVVNYPFDTVEEETSDGKRPPSLTPDNDVFVHLAKVYSENHLTMRKSTCQDSGKFEGGITNGAAWYPVIGGMQDYNYAFHGCMELTLEISCCKYPSAKDLPQYWEQNKIALVKYCQEALKGVTGLILDSVSLKPVQASLQVSGRNMTFFSSKTGEFWRLLLPGRYVLKVSAKGYYDQDVSFVVENRNNTMPQLTNLTVFMINSSLTTSSTTIRQRTTETSVQVSEDTLDGAPTTKSTFPEVSAEFKPTAAGFMTRLNEENSGERSEVQVYNYLFLFFLFFY